MKAHLAKVSLALLSAGFLLGCQEQGSGPVGPEGPLFDGKGKGTCEFPVDEHCHGDDDGVVATFRATWESGPITGDAITLTEGNGQRFLGGERTTLNFIEDDGSLAAFLDGVTGGSICFAAKTFFGPFQFHLQPSDPKAADMLFSFTALATDGTDVNYELTSSGVATVDLPPATIIDPSFVTWTNFDIHRANGPGNKVACSGTGSLNSIMKVMRN